MRCCLWLRGASGLQYKLVRESFKMDGRPQKMSGGSKKELVFPRPRGGDQKNTLRGGAALVKDILGIPTGKREGHGLVSFPFGSKSDAGPFSVLMGSE